MLHDRHKFFVQYSAQGSRHSWCLKAEINMLSSINICENNTRSSCRLSTLLWADYAAMLAVIVDLTTHAVYYVVTVLLVLYD